MKPENPKDWAAKTHESHKRMATTKRLQGCQYDQVYKDYDKLQIQPAEWEEKKVTYAQPVINTKLT